LQFLRAILPLRIVDSPLFPVAKPYAWALPVIGVLGLLSGVLESVGIGLLVPIIALLLEQRNEHLPAPIRAIFSVTDGLDQQAKLLSLCGLLVVFILFKGLIQAGSTIFAELVDGRLARDIRNALCRRLLALDYPFFLRTESPRLVHIIATESWHTAEMIRYATQIIPAAITLAVFGAMLFWLSWVLALGTLAGALTIHFILTAVERRQRTLAGRAVSHNLVLAERMLAVINGMRAIRIFGQQDREFGKFLEASELTRLSGAATRRLSAKVVQLLESLVAVLFVGILIVGHQVVGLSVPVLLAFLMLLTRAQPQAKAISRARIDIAALSGSVGEVEWLLGQEPAPVSVSGSLPIAAIDQPIRFESVDYRYSEGAPALRDVSLTIRPGVATALIGDSGAGKTTIVNLICRLVEPTSGIVFHGDVPLPMLRPDQWRSRIAIAGQDIDLLDGTVAENIAYGAPSATRDEIEDAARAAGAAGFIEALERGYDTRLGLNTLSLSGGQRQRIGLARALVRHPDLLILDEAMSAVDSISESEIMKLLAEHLHFRSALVVSHRKSTLALCEDCIVIEEGRVVDSGRLENVQYYRAMP
jgi:subfamily B ATP-binding cassette protein MsbA